MKYSFAHLNVTSDSCHKISLHFNRS